jgi:hypothetical protein
MHTTLHRLWPRGRAQCRGTEEDAARRDDTPIGMEAGTEPSMAASAPSTPSDVARPVGEPAYNPSAASLAAAITVFFSLSTAWNLVLHCSRVASGRRPVRRDTYHRSST